MMVVGVGDGVICYRMVSSVSSVTCRRSVVSSGYSGFLHQITNFIIIISPP